MAAGGQPAWRTQLALPRLSFPRPEVPRYIPDHDSDELDA